MWTNNTVLSFISGHFGLWVDENLYLGRSSPCFTFNNCCLSETDDFRIMDLEAWTFSWRLARGRLHLHRHHRSTLSLIIHIHLLIRRFNPSSAGCIGVQWILLDFLSSLPAWRKLDSGWFHSVLFRVGLAARLLKLNFHEPGPSPCL